MNIASLSLTELIQCIRRREMAPSELVRTYLDRVDLYDQRQHAFVEVWKEEAMRQAALSDQRLARGDLPRPLEGIPLALKDLVDVQGTPTSAGSTARARQVASRTATIARRLQDAGAILMGKTHLVELALGGWGTNAGMGTPLNPWDQEHARISGGSSSGSAVAVASGFVAGAIGTDTGGSVRIPSAFCGLTGLKTTQGRVSRQGVVPLCDTLDTMGPMTWSAEDAAHLMQAMHGPDPLAPDTAHIPAEDFLSGLRQPVNGLRYSVLKSPLWTNGHPQIAHLVKEVCQVLTQLGCIAEHRHAVDIDLLEDQKASGTIIAFEGYSHHGRMLETTEIAGDPAARARILRGAQISMHEYATALEERRARMPRVHGLFDAVDFLVLPTVTVAAPRLEEIDENAPTPSQLTRFVGYYGLCAIALPCGTDSSGLPLSVQLVAAPCQEALLLRLGLAYQSVTEHHRKRPTLK